MDFHLSEEELEIQKSTRAFVQAEVVPMVELFESGKGSAKQLMQMMGKEGLFRLLVPKKYGGRYERVRSLPLCVAREELARGYNYAAACIATQGLAAVPIVIGGNQEQKEAYLPGLGSGELIGSFSITEPNAGSDAASLSTHAMRTGNEYEITGEKRFASNAGICDFYIIFAKTDPAKGAKGISAFLVDGGTKGLLFKPIHILCYDVLGHLKLEQIRVPAGNRLGEEGEGFKLAMQTLDVLRATVGAHAVGTAQAALDYALTYAGERRQFDKPLLKQQSIRFKLAEMAVSISAARLLVYQAAVAKDEGAPDITLKSSMAKLFATESAQKVVDEALQIFGGNGVVVKEYPMERLYREVRAPRVYEGTSEIQKLIIAGQVIKGAPRIKEV